jgi:hypothetical protein
MNNFVCDNKNILSYIVTLLLLLYIGCLSVENRPSFILMFRDIDLPKISNNTNCNINELEVDTMKQYKLLQLINNSYDSIVLNLRYTNCKNIQFYESDRIDEYRIFKDTSILDDGIIIFTESKDTVVNILKNDTLTFLLKINKPIKNIGRLYHLTFKADSSNKTSYIKTFYKDW